MTGNAIFDVPRPDLSRDRLTTSGPMRRRPIRIWSRTTSGCLQEPLHIRGGYYTQDALDIAVPATVDRLEKGLPFLYCRRGINASSKPIDNRRFLRVTATIP